MAQSHDQLDELIHQRTRLAIMATLTGVEGLEFNDLKGDLALTDGNLSTHLSALEKAGYISVTKDFKGKKPCTTIAMTAKGRKAMENYVNLLQGILKLPKAGRGGKAPL
jgi:DNA-binding MarR family transcriptional regulator